MGKGIEFYKQKHYECFNDSEETVKFTYIMNYIFDALNRKYPVEGIRPNNNDLKVYLVLHVIVECLCFRSSDKFKYCRSVA